MLLFLSWWPKENSNYPRSLLVLSPREGSEAGNQISINRGTVKGTGLSFLEGVSAGGKFTQLYITPPDWRQCPIKPLGGLRNVTLPVDS